LKDLSTKLSKTLFRCGVGIRHVNRPAQFGRTEYWLSVAPPGRMPGRQHISPEDIVPLLRRVWLLDVYRNPLRFRYRLVGTEIARSLDQDVTGRWLDEVQPESVVNALVRDRYRFMAETGRPTWRHGLSFWERNPKHHSIENCLVPLARGGGDRGGGATLSILTSQTRVGISH
jgi:hypothetical protein